MTDARTALPRMNVLDKAVAALNPRAGLDRMQAKTALRAYTSFGVNKTSASTKGTLSNWIVKRLPLFTEKLERETTADRAEDLVTNDPHAAGLTESMSINIVGTGLVPQSAPNERVLGWSEAHVREYQAQAKWSFGIWASEDQKNTEE